MHRKTFVILPKLTAMECYPEVSRIVTCLLIQLLLLAVVVDSASTEFESPV